MKRDFTVFGFPPTLYRRPTFSSSKLILREVVLPSFLKSCLSNVKVYNTICLFYPWILSLPFTYLLIFDRSIHLLKKSVTISHCWLLLRFFIVLVKSFIFLVLQKTQEEDTVVNSVFCCEIFLFLAIWKPIKIKTFLNSPV